MPFHAMIFLGRSQVEAFSHDARMESSRGLETSDRLNDAVREPRDEQFVVYHTGPTGNDKGIVKRLSIAELMNYPDPRWRPVASNPAFLGVYRWNILRGAECCAPEKTYQEMQA